MKSQAKLFDTNTKINRSFLYHTLLLHVLVTRSGSTLGFARVWHPPTGFGSVRFVRSPAGFSSVCEI